MGGLGTWSACCVAVSPSVWPLARFLGGHGALGLLRRPQRLRACSEVTF